MTSQRTDTPFVDNPLPGAKLIADGYLGVPRAVAVTSQPQQSSIFTASSIAKKSGEGSKNQNGTYASKKKKKVEKQSSINSGLTILPWDNFIHQPTCLKELFHLERDGVITYDPEEVNVFFHATRMMRPSFGDISENGKSWILTVKNVGELEQIRAWITERVSIFGVTLVNRNGLFGKAERAPCLIALDPREGSLRDRIYYVFMKSVAAMEKGHNFCIELNFNGAMENWCTRITNTKCDAVGARLIVTNGDEKDQFLTAENVVCCIACFPVWAIQTSIIQIHRHIRYEDFSLDFSAEELTLHGVDGGIDNQRKKLFRSERKEVFRTKPAEHGLAGMDPRGTGNVDENKYICIKKYDKPRPGTTKPLEESIDEYETVSLEKLLSHIKERKRSAKVSTADFSSKNGADEIVSEGGSSTDNNLTDDGKIVKQSLHRKMPSDHANLVKAEVTVHKSDEPTNSYHNSQSDSPFVTKKFNKYSRNDYDWNPIDNKLKTDVAKVQDEKSPNIDDNKAMETILFKGYTRKVRLSEDYDDGFEEKLIMPSPTPKRHDKKSPGKFGKPNHAFESDESDDEKKEKPSREVYYSKELSSSSDDQVEILKSSSRSVKYMSQPNNVNTEESNRKAQENPSGPLPARQQSVNDSEDDFNKCFPEIKQASQVIETNEKLLNETHYPKLLQNNNEQEGEMAFRKRGPLFAPDDDMFEGRTTNVIPVDKTDKTCLIDNTDDELDDDEEDDDERGIEGDMELTDCELDYDDEEDDKNKKSKPESADPIKRPVSRNRRRTARYDSTRKYLGIPTRKQLKHRPPSNELPSPTKPIAEYGAFELM